MSSHSYTNEDIINAVQQSTSKRQVLILLGLAPKGGNYVTVTKKIKELDLNTDHFKGQGWSRNQTIGPRRPVEDYLSNKIAIQSNKLRKRLLADKILDCKCYNCLNTTWMGVDIPLELEHINGNHLDNTLSNLTLLCPNCHALTDTYRGKNIKKK